MKYLPKRNLFFVHIPKCAGTSVSRALDLPDDPSFDTIIADLGNEDAVMQVGSAGSTSNLPSSFGKTAPHPKNGFFHPELGHIFPVHLTLYHVRSILPKTWAALCGSHSFALVRDPRARFVSALMQRVREFNDELPLRSDDPALLEEAKRVCDWLDGRDRFTDVTFVHFTRQIDFVDLEGQRVVKAVFPVHRTDLARDWIARETGLEIEIARVHVRREPKAWARILQPAARFSGRRLVPRSLKRKLHPIWANSVAFSNAADRYGETDLGVDVEAFVKEYYAKDYALYGEAVASSDTVSDTSRTAVD